jgi:hypothetical protein
MIANSRRDSYLELFYLKNLFPIMVQRSVIKHGRCWVPILLIDICEIRIVGIIKQLLKFKNLLCFDIQA